MAVGTRSLQSPPEPPAVLTLLLSGSLFTPWSVSHIPTWKRFEPSLSRPEQPSHHESLWPSVGFVGRANTGRRWGCVSQFRMLEAVWESDVCCSHDAPVPLGACGWLGQAEKWVTCWPCFCELDKREQVLFPDHRPLSFSSHPVSQRPAVSVRT